MVIHAMSKKTNGAADAPETAYEHIEYVPRQRIGRIYVTQNDNKKRSHNSAENQLQTPSPTDHLAMEVRPK